jgi:hypothetical protein
VLGPASGAHGSQRPFPILFTSGRPPTSALREALLRRGLEADSKPAIPLSIVASYVKSGE